METSFKVLDALDINQVGVAYCKAAIASTKESTLVEYYQSNVGKLKFLCWEEFLDGRITIAYAEILFKGVIYKLGKSAINQLQSMLNKWYLED